MKAWNEFNYDISYVDNNEMSTIHVLTNTENLGKIIDEIINKGGFDIRVKKVEDYDYDYKKAMAYGEIC